MQSVYEERLLKDKVVTQAEIDAHTSKVKAYMDQVPNPSPSFDLLTLESKRCRV
jgi:hypothetical protein